MNKIISSLLCYSLIAPMVLQAQPSTLNKKYQRNPVFLVAESESSPSNSLCSETCTDPANALRISMSHTEGSGIGYDQGYTSLDAFINFSKFGNFYPFFDIRGHMSNDGHPSANGGFGVRYLPNSINAVFGINGFFDFRQARHSTFEQVGAGLEILGTQWKWTANGYLPIIQNTNITNVTFAEFSGHHALLYINRELALKGLESSLGRSLIHRGFYGLDLYLGGYIFEGHRGLRAKGG